jgi:hypothetical protein
VQQQALGNEAVEQLLASRAVQARLTVTPPSDAYEQEAERVADEVTRGSGPAPGTAGPTPAAGISRLPDSVRRAAKAESKDDKKKPPEAAPRQEPKKKEDDKVKRETAKKKDDDKRVKRQADTKDEDEKLQRQPAPDSDKQDDEKLQRAADGTGVPDVSPDVERSLTRQAGVGHPLPENLRSHYEPRFGADLSHVRLHTDQDAASAAKDLKAEAFTRGSDVYFAAGKYQPGSDAGRRLIAHELTHTLQQSPGAAVQPKRSGRGAPLVAPASVVQRQGDEGGDAADDAGQESGERITFSSIPVPKIKYPRRADRYDAKKPLIRTAGYDREAAPPNQREKWKKVGKLTKPIRDALEAKHKTDVGQPAAGGVYAFQFIPPGVKADSPDSQTGGPLYTGSLDDVAGELTVPRWSRSDQLGKVYEVDHVVELQLAGYPKDDSGNTLDNFELLEKRKNASSGSSLMHAIRKKITAFLRKKENLVPKDRLEDKQKKIDEVRARYELAFEAPAAGGGQDVTPEDVWTKDEIASGEHLKNVHARNPDALGTADKVLVTLGSAGTPREFTAGTAIPPAEQNAFAPLRLVEKKIDTSPGASGANLGTLTATLPGGNKYFEAGTNSPPLPISKVGAARYLGTIDKGSLFDLFGNLRFKQFSPVQVDTVDVVPGKGMMVAGRIQPEISLLRGASLDFQLVGDDLTLLKRFSVEDVKVPRPFSVDECSLTVAVSTREALSVTGRVDFGIERVGSGFVEGRVGTAGGFGLAGEFNFDTKVFDPAKVAVAYTDDKWTAEGTIGIPDGRIKGVKSATVSVKYASETIEASGTADLSIPGIKSAGVSVAYAEADGLTIKGNVNLAEGIPGIRGGSADVEVKKAEGGDWSVRAKGTATPAIPGIDSTLDVTYDDGEFAIQGHAALSRGMLKGEATLGATNRAVDAEGNPTGPPGDRLVAFGSGSATISFTPWLAGTAGLRILPNGELEVSGKIGLPSSVDVFPEKKVEKNVFSLGLDIPIVGVAVAGQRIGIFATIRGGLDASAGFGPGQLRNLFAEVTYNPDHEEDTTVHGHGEFHVPAHAGLRLFVRGGIGAGIPIVSATANLEVGGQLGIEGAADAMVDVNWSPRTGLALDATASLSAQPKFKLDVTGLVLVEADLLVTKVTLYEKRWQLAAFEFGSDLTFGLTFPIHYRSGEPFDVKLEDVQFQLPEIDPGSMLRDLFAKIT